MDKITIYENWIKPPKLVHYSNSIFECMTKEALICNFNFPEKYSKNDFYLFGKKVLNAGEMHHGKRFFFVDRFYSLLEFYSENNQISAYYFDLTLPAKIIDNNVYILDLKLDFFVLPDKKSYFLLDEDELEDAIKCNFFSNDEIEICLKTTNKIKNLIENDMFDNILTDFEHSNHSKWVRYSDKDFLLGS